MKYPIFKYSNIKISKYSRSADNNHLGSRSSITIWVSTAASLPASLFLVITLINGGDGDGGDDNRDDKGGGDGGGGHDVESDDGCHDHTVNKTMIDI